MNIIVQLRMLLILAVTGGTALADGTNSVLLRVAGKLQSAWPGLTPLPTCEYPDDLTLVIKYQTGTFTVPARSMAASPANPRLVQDIGPNTNGFLLQIHLERLGEANQTVTPRTNQETLWQTFYNCTPVANTPYQIYWALSYGGQTDPDLLERVKQNLWHQGLYVRRTALPNIASEPERPAAPENLQIK